MVEWKLFIENLWEQSCLYAKWLNNYRIPDTNRTIIYGFTPIKDHLSLELWWTRNTTRIKMNEKETLVRAHSKLVECFQTSLHKASYQTLSLITLLLVCIFAPSAQASWDILASVSFHICLNGEIVPFGLLVLALFGQLNCCVTVTKSLPRFCTILRIPVPISHLVVKCGNQWLKSRLCQCQKYGWLAFHINRKFQVHGIPEILFSYLL